MTTYELVHGAWHGALAKSLLVPEPLAPLGTPAHITDGQFGRVPRVYVECTDDRAITHAAQRRMQLKLPCRERITLDADHSPFFSRSAELSDILLRYQRQPGAGFCPWPLPPGRWPDPPGPGRDPPPCPGRELP